MRTKGVIKEIREQLYNNVVEQFQSSGALNEAAKAGVTTVDDITKVITAVKSVISAANYEGNMLPDYLYSYKTFDDASGKVASVALTVKTKLKADYPYKATVEFALDENFIKNVENHFVDTIFTIFDAELATDNLNGVNAVIADICKENEIPYDISFVLADTKTLVTEITDTKIVFAANIDAAFGIATSTLFQSGDAYSDKVREIAVAEFVEKIKACPNTVSIIKSHASIIDTLTDAKTKKRAERLIRKAYHRKAENLDVVKSGIGYYEGTHNDTEIFALVEKAEDGTLSVVLKPFDIHTLVNVDFDVIAAIK